MESQILRRMWQDSAPECCVCRKRVDSMMESQSNYYDTNVTITFLCHGKSESILIPGMSIASRPAHAMLTAWPKRIFLKNWARYSLVKPAREGRLE
jgi:hypothetical protein